MHLLSPITQGKLAKEPIACSAAGGGKPDGAPLVPGQNIILGVNKDQRSPFGVSAFRFDLHMVPASRGELSQ